MCLPPSNVSVFLCVSAHSLRLTHTDRSERDSPVLRSFAPSKKTQVPFFLRRQTPKRRLKATAAEQTLQWWRPTATAHLNKRTESSVRFCSDSRSISSPSLPVPAFSLYYYKRRRKRRESSAHSLPPKTLPCESIQNVSCWLLGRSELADVKHTHTLLQCIFVQLLG